MTVYVCEDMAVHRAFRKLQPYQLDATDEEQFAGMTEVISLETLLSREGTRGREAEPLPMGRVTVPDVAPSWTELQPDALMTLAHRAPETYAGLLKVIAPQVDSAVAEVIRGLRVEDGYSWRALARWCFDAALVRWPHRPDNQLAGMALCAAAAEHFSEHYMSPPWNELPA